MEKVTHGPLLKAAMARKGLGRMTVADFVGVHERTVTNWTTGKTMPSEKELVRLRGLLGVYDVDGDDVETAVRQSELTQDRQYTVIGFYHRQLREQREGRSDVG